MDHLSRLGKALLADFPVRLFVTFGALFDWKSRCCCGKICKADFSGFLTTGHIFYGAWPRWTAMEISFANLRAIARNGLLRSWSRATRIGSTPRRRECWVIRMGRRM